MHDRFLAVHPVYGIISHHSCWCDAARAAEEFVKREPTTCFEVEVHDRLARRRNPEVWRRTSAAPSYLTIKGTRITNQITAYPDGAIYQPVVVKV